MEKMHNEGNHENLIEFFQKQQSMFDEINKKGFKEYALSLTNLSEAFQDHDKCVRCMDEGTPGGFHSAGSGILLNEDEAIEAFKKAGVKEITSHDGCGAAGLYAKAKGLDALKADEYGKEFSKRIAEKLGVPYKHISYEEMNRPASHHIARVAYYDNTGKFDYSKVKELPAGFIISRGIQQPQTSISEATVAFNIATGNHGFGELISEENPFIISVIGKNEDEINQLKSELSGLESLGKKIKIDGFVYSEK